jgi:hypothetical protein
LGFLIRTATQNPPAFLRAPLVKLLTNGDFYKKQKPVKNPQKPEKGLFLGVTFFLTEKIFLTPEKRKSVKKSSAKTVLDNFLVFSIFPLVKPVK